MTNGIRCDGCRHSRKTTIEESRMGGSESTESLVCDLGYRIGLDGSPAEDCEYEPIESGDEEGEEGE